jgi:hypothetical protein
MTYKDDDKKDDPEIMVDATIPAANQPGVRPNEPPIPDGHARFYCEKCHTVRSSLFFVAS